MERLIREIKRSWRKSARSGGFLYGLKKWSNPILAVTTIGILFIYSCQLRQMKLGSEIATKSLKRLKKNERLEQRAWITTAGITGFPEAGKSFRVKVVITNTGKTLAKKVIAVCGADPVTLGQLPDFNNRLREIEENQKREDTRAMGLVPPQGKSETTLEPKPPDFTFTEDDIKNLKSGNPRFILYGVITYDDIFNQRHWFAFCTFLNYNPKESDNGGWNYMLLGKYNDTGDGNIPSDFWK